MTCTIKTKKEIKEEKDSRSKKENSQDERGERDSQENNEEKSQENNCDAGLGTTHAFWSRSEGSRGFLQEGDIIRLPNTFECIKKRLTQLGTTSLEG